jgi:serine/threonine-protein kinase RsbW
MHDQVPFAIRTQMGIAVAEIVANIVEHGGADRQLLQIEMQITVQSDHVLVVLIDDGNEAHVDLGSACMPEDVLAERGRGLAMATLVLYRLTYQREAGANYWTMASHPFDFIEAVA